MQRTDAANELLAWQRIHPAGITHLFSRDDLQAYAALASSLALNTTGYYAECRLTEPRQLDLLMGFSRHRTNLDLLVDRLARQCESADETTLAAWTAVRDFVQLWATPDLAIHRMVSAIWLEFDDVRRSASHQAPSISACVVPDYGRAFRPNDVLDRDAKAGLLTSVYRALAANDTEEEIIDLLRSCTYALPNGADLIHVSLMTGRSPRAVKIYGVAPRTMLGSYLRTIGWCGSFSALHSVMQRLAVPGLCGDDIYFDLNLSNMHLPGESTLGVAFSQQQVGPDARRLTLLQHLAEEGQCTPQQAAVLGAWSTLAPEQGASNPYRRVSRHLDLKTVLGGRKGLETKAYLGFRVESNPFVIGH